MNGELIGINSAIISRSGGNVGIGFAVPTEIASSIMQQILDFGEIRRGLLGVRIQTVDAAAAEALGSNVSNGALITDITPDSGAEKAGLRVGDIVTGVNGEAVTNSPELRNRIGLLRSGDTVTLTYVRENEKRTASATLGSAVNQMATGESIHEGLSGAVFAAATASSEDGVSVTEVQEGSPAAQRGTALGRSDYARQPRAGPEFERTTADSGAVSDTLPECETRRQGIDVPDPLTSVACIHEERACPVNTVLSAGRICILAGLFLSAEMLNAADIDRQRELFVGVYADAELGIWESVEQLDESDRRLLSEYVLWPDLRATWLNATIQTSRSVRNRRVSGTLWRVKTRARPALPSRVEPGE